MKKIKERKTIYLDQEVYREARQFMYFNNITMSALVEKALLDLFKKRGKK